MSNWRDRITPERCDWGYLEERHFKAARMAGARLGSDDSDPMMDADDWEQDALLYMASHRKAVEAFTATSQLVRHLVSRLLRSAAEDKKAAAATARGLDIEQME